MLEVISYHISLKCQLPLLLTKSRAHVLYCQPPHLEEFFQNMDPKISNPNNNKDTNNHQLLNVWSMAGEIGLLIAVPVVVLVLLGIKLDKLFSTTPLFIIIGIILAAIISIIGVTRKIKKINLL